MIEAESRARPEDVRQSARHRLFVEGADPDGPDPFVLRELLGDLPVRVDALGPSFHVECAAAALAPSHPTYYFLIDRDHRSDEAIEKTWTEFLEPDKSSLLIWRRRELESYLLLPEYIGKSEWLKCSADELLACIVRECQKRVYLDAANLVIIRLREELKEKWVEQFPSPEDFATAGDALKALLDCPELKARAQQTADRLEPARIEELFHGVLNRMLDGEAKVTPNRGEWLAMVRAKHVLPSVISKCFKVTDLQGHTVQGREARHAMATRLLALPPADQPDDFRQLHRLMEQRVRSTRSINRSTE